MASSKEDKTKPEIKAPPIHLKKQLIIAATLIVIVGIVIIILGKFIIGGILSLLGAVFGVGAQVAQDTEL